MRPLRHTLHLLVRPLTLSCERGCALDQRVWTRYTLSGNVEWSSGVYMKAALFCSCFDLQPAFV